MDLTDEQWLAVAPLLPPSLPSKRGRPACDTRLVLNGILWKLRTASRGKICRSPIPPTSLAIATTRSGVVTACWMNCWIS